ncbi:pyrroline-5-carboxylate reductase [bacterium]|nr:pyrroline-5-carboxylate reductase [bacterium]
MSIKNINNVKLGVIGCGKMASAILGGVVSNGFLKPENIFVYDINPEIAGNLAKNYGFTVENSIENLLNSSNTILLAVKPFVVNEVMENIKNSYNNHLVMSILAGVKIEKYLSFIPDINIIRIMPNTPALINLGMSAVCPSQNSSESDCDFVIEFMKNCGEVLVTKEDEMDIITALSGSGPAYFYKIIELMASAAHKLGFDYKKALLLSAQTALGSAKMVIENDFNVNQLIKNVTTPGGCTEVGNNVLNNSDIDMILDKTIKDTAQKAHDLG